MPDESLDPTAEELANEKDLRRFEAEAAFRQSNVLPLDYAMNEGRFYGLLMRGGRPLTAVQRIGFLLIAIMLCVPSFFIALASVPSWRHVISGGVLGGGVPMFYLPIAALVFLTGIRVVWVALRSSRKPKANLGFPADSDAVAQRNHHRK
ncbi:MAG: hypothetical protein WA638_07375 [Candidatus Acidiferrales bacterium]